MDPDNEMCKNVVEKSDNSEDGCENDHEKLSSKSAAEENNVKPEESHSSSDTTILSSAFREFMKTKLQYNKLEKKLKKHRNKCKTEKKELNEVDSFDHSEDGKTSSSSESSRTTSSSSDSDLLEAAFRKKSMKAVVSLVEYAKRKGINVSDLDRENIKPYDHEECEFLTICSCASCLEFRVVINDITMADRNANVIWNAFKNSLVICYKSLFQKFPNATKAVADYKRALHDPSMHWLVSGPMTDSVFLQILHNMDNVPIADKLLFIVLIGIMGKYDPYQLLELLAFNIKCACNVYADHLQSIIDKSEGKTVPAKEFITLLVDGYEELLRVVKKTIPIIYEYEVHYLRRFGIYWSLLHRRIYQKLVYIRFATVVLKCLVELKKKEEDELFKRYLSFDVDFCKMDYLWEPVWDKLDEHNSSLEQLDRDFQIGFIWKSFFLLQSDSLPFKQGIIPPNKWATHENKELVWRNILQHIRKFLPEEYRCNLHLPEKCEKCSNDLDLHGNNCECVTCSIAGPKRFIKGNNETKLCSKCVNITGYCEVFPGKKLYDHIAKNHAKDENDQYYDCENESIGTYHISWAIFKQIKSRKPYIFRTLDEKYFCIDCKEHSCWIARKIINNKITKNLSNYLIDNYIDIPISPSEVAPMMTEIMLYISQLYDDPKCIDKEFEDDEILMYFWTIVVTLFSKCFKDEVNNTGVNLALFELVDKDIRLKRNEIIGDEGSILIRSLLYKMGTSRDSILANRDEAESMPSISFDSSDVQNLSDSSESHPDECPHMREEKTKRKEKHPGKKRSKKDCNHARVNETRDRLRQKLKNAKNTPPPPPPITTEDKFQYMCEGISNMKIEGKGNMSIKITAKHKVKPPEPTSTYSSNGNSRTSSIANNPVQQMSIQETLSFIEGNSEKFKKPLDDKKVAKKAKQKLKREESRRIAVLQELKDQFHEIYFKEFLMKDDLKKLKTSKSKNKKKINELEAATKKLNKSKSQVEAYILDLISTLKITNSEFKFTYLPTKEQQQEFLKTKEKKSTPTPPPTPQPTVPSQPQQQQPIPNYSSTVRLSFAHPGSDENVDPSKRMVTIRRINLPNVAEPQVTVTAKGMAPGQDELLYRFINGQLVQAKMMKEGAANYVQQQMQNPPQMQSQPPTKQKNKKQREPTPTQQPEVKKKTKTQIKKEKREAKLLEQEKEKERLEKENSKKPDVNANTTPHNRNKAESKKESQKDNSLPQNGVGNKPKQKVVDNGQFDNNQFKMLHMEDFVTESSESEEQPSEHNSSIEEKLAPPKPQPKKSKDKKQNKTTVEVKQMQKTVDIKNTTNGVSKKSKKNKNKDIKAPAQNVLTESTATYNPSVYPTPPPSVFDFYHPQTGNHQLRPQYHDQQKLNSQIYQQMNSANNNSIMEQLNRGVQVEHLTLPPGITLTKIDPSKAEALRARTESIAKLSKPIEQVVNPAPPPFYQHIITGGYNQPSVDQSGIIMVDAMGAKQSQYSTSSALSVPEEKMSKNKKKKNKKKIAAAAINSNNTPQANPSVPQMVTLKNPMFHGQFAQNPTNYSQTKMPGHLKSNEGVLGGMAAAGEQPAKIIKNENGMFTIRRSGPELGMNYASTNGPAMNSAVPNYSHFTPKYYPTSTSDSYSHFGTNYFNGQTTEESDYRPPRCISAIGSEVKNAQQQKKSQEWIGTNKCCSSNNSNNSCSGGGNGSGSGGYPSTSLFNGYDSFPSTSTHSSASSHSYLPAPSNCGSLFDDAMAHHNCDDSPPPISHEFKPYLDGIPNTGVISYNDASILKHLMPGQKLNNEVSIHNINESNFTRNNLNTSPNRVDITPIFGHRGHDDFTGSSGRSSSNFVDFQGGLFPSKTPDELNLSDPIDVGGSFNKMLNVNTMNANTANRESHSRTSPFLDNATLESFIQNMSSLKLAGGLVDDNNSTTTTSTNQQHHSPEKVSWW